MDGDHPVHLFIVPTPIGNLSDVTRRALDVLGSVHVVLAEDTRQTRKLLDHAGIAASMESHHQHNEHRTVERLVERMRAGERMALVSDAGTPGISDPGFLLARAAIEAGLEVSTLPGPTAFVPALVNSGLPCDRFIFEGFLPHKKGRQTRLKRLADEDRTIVLYASPHRLVKTLRQLGEHLGADRRASVSREISKKFEETVRGSLAELEAHFESVKVRGEFVVVVGGRGVVVDGAEEREAEK